MFILEVQFYSVQFTSISLCIYAPIYLSIYLFIYLSIYLSFNLSIYDLYTLAKESSSPASSESESGPGECPGESSPPIPPSSSPPIPPTPCCEGWEEWGDNWWPRWWWGCMGRVGEGDGCGETWPPPWECSLRSSCRPIMLEIKNGRDALVAVVLGVHRSWEEGTRAGGDWSPLPPRLIMPPSWGSLTPMLTAGGPATEALKIFKCLIIWTMFCCNMKYYRI